MARSKRKRNDFELIELNQNKRQKRGQKRRADDDELITVTTGTTTHSGHYHGVHQQQVHTHHHGLNMGDVHQLRHEGNSGFGADGVSFAHDAHHHAGHAHTSHSTVHGVHHGTIHGTARHTTVSRTMTKGEYRAMVRRQLITYAILLGLLGGGFYLWSQGLLTNLDFLPPPPTTLP